MDATVARARVGTFFGLARDWGGKLWEFPKISTFFLLLVVICAIFAGQVAPRSPTKADLAQVYAPPAFVSEGSATHLLGTDALGRDILSRIIWGARISLTVGLGGVAVAAVIGTVIGLFSGYLGRRVDTILSGITDLWFSIPPILFLLLLALIIGRSTNGVIIGLAVLSWPKYTRIVRGQVLALKARDFVASAKVAGSSPWRIMAVHIFPNLVNSLIVLATLDVGRFIVLESTLSFLGLGVQPPTPAWGVMIADGRNLLAVAWWVTVMPGLALAATVLAANSFGDWLRDRLDPIQRPI